MRQPPHRRRALPALIATLIGALLAPLVSAAQHDRMEGTPMVQRQVSVTGSATLEADPDHALVRLGVAESRPSAEQARDAVAKVVGAFRELCRGLGVEAQDVSTTGVRIYPEYARQTRGASDEGPRIVGYRVSRELVVVLRDLEQLGPLIERSIALGANQASPPRFAVTDEARFQREALKLAALDARARAEVLASTLDAKLGAVRDIATDDAAVRPPVERYSRSRLAAAAGPSSGEETYEPGQISIDVRVRATFDLITE
ncbi:MAG: SIMPL domain-containing protein [Pseudomonadota bacterium]